MIETILVLSGICWIFYKFSRTKSVTSLFAAIVLITTLPTRWPLYYSWYLSFSLMAFLGAGFLIYENHLSSKKKASSLAFMHIVLYIGFGCIFLVEFLAQK